MEHRLVAERERAQRAEPVQIPALPGRRPAALSRLWSPWLWVGLGTVCLVALMALAFLR